jgi:hypothetical protein
MSAIDYYTTYPDQANTYTISQHQALTLAAHRAVDDALLRYFAPDSLSPEVLAETVASAARAVVLKTFTEPLAGCYVLATDTLLQGDAREIAPDAHTRHARRPELAVVPAKAGV